MRTEKVLDRLFAADAVLTAVRAHRATLVESLDRRYPPPRPPQVGEAGATFSHEVHVDHLSDDLRSARDRLASSEDRHQRKLALIDELLRLREELMAPLSQRFFQVRHTLESLFGRGRGFTLANVSGRTPQNPKRLVELAEQTVAFLRDPAVEVPSHGLDGVRVDFERLARDLERPLVALREALTALAGARKQADSTLAAREEALAELQGTYRWVRHSLEGLFHLAGLHAEAEGLRRPARRPRRPQAQEEAAPESTSAEDGSSPEAPSHRGLDVRRDSRKSGQNPPEISEERPDFRQIGEIRAPSGSRAIERSPPLRATLRMSLPEADDAAKNRLRALDEREDPGATHYPMPVLRP